jgi:hypothetical protein
MVSNPNSSKLNRKNQPALIEIGNIAIYIGILTLPASGWPFSKMLFLFSASCASLFS